MKIFQFHRCFAPKAKFLGKYDKWTQIYKNVLCRNTNTLAATFNKMQDPLINWSRFMDDNKGLFNIPQLTDHAGFHLLKENVYYEVENLIKEAINENRSRPIVQIFDEMSDSLCRLADMADFVRVAHPNNDFAMAAEDACMNIGALVEKLNTNTDIYEALSSVIKNGDKFKTDAIDDRVADLFKFDFEQSGIHLDEKKRKEFVQLSEKIMACGHYFMNGTQKAVLVPKEKVPSNVNQWFSNNGDSVHVTGLFNDHYSDVVREVAYKLYLYPNKHQEDILMQLLENRHRLAQLVGFETYAHRTLKNTLVGSPDNAMTFLNTLSKKIKPKVEEDFQKLRYLKKKQGKGGPLAAWDVAYYSGLLRHDKFNLNCTDFSPYFSLGSCMKGLSHLFEKLYGIYLEPQTPKHGEVWCEDVRKLVVVHETEGELATIYCDFFDRPGKPRQDCHFTIQGGRVKNDDSYQDPKVVLMLNFPFSKYSAPLLTPGMAENLFHEFGHAMHSALGRTRYQHVTGTRCPTDFAEVPSVLMEYFAMDPRVLQSYACHYKTGEPIPEDKMNSLCKAKNLCAASEMQLQIFYSVLDQFYHGKHPLDGNTRDVLEYVTNEYYGLPYVSNTAIHLRFGHFVGYGAKYYSYLMSRAVASRIWHQCFQKDPFNRQQGELLRTEVLAHGGGKHPTELIQAMLGEQLSMDSLVQTLINELDEN